jgi:hypothetical protein
MRQYYLQRRPKEHIWLWLRAFNTLPKFARYRVCPVNRLGAALLERREGFMDNLF